MPHFDPLAGFEEWKVREEIHLKSVVVFKNDARSSVE